MFQSRTQTSFCIIHLMSRFLFALSVTVEEKTKEKKGRETWGAVIRMQQADQGGGADGRKEGKETWNHVYLSLCAILLLRSLSEAIVSIICWVWASHLCRWGRQRRHCCCKPFSCLSTCIWHLLIKCWQLFRPQFYSFMIMMIRQGTEIFGLYFCTHPKFNISSLRTVASIYCVELTCIAKCRHLFL